MISLVAEWRRSWPFRVKESQNICFRRGWIRAHQTCICFRICDLVAAARKCNNLPVLKLFCFNSMVFIFECQVTFTLLSLEEPYNTSSFSDISFPMFCDEFSTYRNTYCSNILDLRSKAWNNSVPWPSHGNAACEGTLNAASFKQFVGCGWSTVLPNAVLQMAPNIRVMKVTWQSESHEKEPSHRRLHSRAQLSFNLF
jgi:hypothetical protein